MEPQLFGAEDFGAVEPEADRGFLQVIKPSSSSPIGFFVYH